MDFDSNHASPVLADTVPMSKSRLGIHSALLQRSQAGASLSSGKFATVPTKRPGKLDDVRSNGWLDAMISSSPTRKRLIKDLNGEIASDDEIAYCSWMLKYPSAVNSFDRIKDCAKDKKVAIFLDYDGTLSPIVDDPDCAIMSEAMRDAVKNVVKYFPTAIISGRSRDKVFELVGVTDLYYAGSHGMDIMCPVNDHPDCTKSTNHQGKEVNLFQPAREFIPMNEEVFRTLVEKTKEIKGAKVENHKFCVSVHYRNVDEEDWPTIAQCVHDILKDYPRLRLTHGRKVLEVRPMIDWNKGKAVEFLLESLGLNENVLPIYIGDDKSDEDAFKVLRDNNRGYGILVSHVPRETSAFYSLRDPSEVKQFLKSLVEWKKSQEVDCA